MVAFRLLQVKGFRPDPKIALVPLEMPTWGYHSPRLPSWALDRPVPPEAALFVAGGILAGVISDRLEKRASTCGLMLLLAAPTVSLPPASTVPVHVRGCSSLPLGFPRVLFPQVPPCWSHLPPPARLI